MANEELYTVDTDYTTLKKGRGDWFNNYWSIDVHNLDEDCIDILCHELNDLHEINTRLNYNMDFFNDVFADYKKLKIENDELKNQIKNLNNTLKLSFPSTCLEFLEAGFDAEKKIHTIQHLEHTNRKLQDDLIFQRHENYELTKDIKTVLLLLRKIDIPFKISYSEKNAIERLENICGGLFE